MAECNIEQTQTAKICPVCTVENGIHALVCSVCGTHISDPADTSPKWLCNHCTVLNADSDSKCSLCHHERGSLPSSKPAKPGTKGDSNNDNHNKGDVPPHRKLVRQKSALSRECRHDHKHRVHSIMNSLGDTCKKTNTRYEDTEFPASADSICPTSAMEEVTALRQSVTHWACPRDIVCRSKDSKHKWTLFNSPSSNDIVQGLLGNCWFASSLSLLAERPALLHQVFISKVYNPEGVYAMRLCKDGEWVEVIVDDKLPCLPNGELAFCKGRRKQLWVPLLEKAMAKLHGSYAALVSGTCQEGLAILTGFSCDSVHISSHRRKSNVHEKDLLWAKLLSSQESGFLMGCSCGTSDISPDLLKDMGLVSNHAYSILDVKLVHNERLLRLRNSWGSFSWLGDWGENSPKWHSVPDDVKSSLPIAGKEEGLFWICLDDFICYFSSVYICYTREGWHETRTPGWFPSSIDTDAITMTHLYVLDTTEIDISLHQQSVRGEVNQDLIDALLVVFDDKWNLVCRSKRLLHNHVNCTSVFYPGAYRIYCLSFTKWNSGPIKYTLVTHSLKPVIVEQIAVPASALAEVLIKLAIKEGTADLCDGSGTRLLYALNKHWSGQITVAVNMSKNKYLHIRSDLTESTNLITSRGLQTVDSIPPGYGQVINILTHLESSMAFSVRSRLEYKASSEIFPSNWSSSDMHSPEISESLRPIHQPIAMINI